MTVLTFPSIPTLWQVYFAPTGVSYTYDGVKWVVEPTTLEAVTNSIQDSVAPLFVDGVHNGINVTYNTTNNQLSLALEIDGGDASTTF